MPFDRSLYPNDWDEISERIRKRAGDKCEECGAPNKAEIVRGGHWSSWWRLFNPEFDEPHRHILGPRVVRVVLTVAHMDHNTENSEDTNLRALCQRCHLRHDQGQHMRNAAATRRRKRVEAGQAELPEVQS
jgi:5-methylcytosine-specific restriction endonuclease McrA